MGCQSSKQVLESDQVTPPARPVVARERETASATSSETPSETSSGPTPSYDDACLPSYADVVSSGKGSMFGGKCERCGHVNNGNKAPSGFEFVVIDDKLVVLDDNDSKDCKEKWGKEKAYMDDDYFSDSDLKLLLEDQDGGLSTEAFSEKSGFHGADGEIYQLDLSSYDESSFSSDEFSALSDEEKTAALYEEDQIAGIPFFDEPVGELWEDDTFAMLSPSAMQTQFLESAEPCLELLLKGQRAVREKPIRRLTDMSMSSVSSVGSRLLSRVPSFPTNSVPWSLGAGLLTKFAKLQHTGFGLA